MNSDLAGVAAVAVALISAVGGWYTARWAARPGEAAAEADAASHLLASWDTLSDRLQQEVDRVRRACHEEITVLRKQHAADVARWATERAELMERIETLERRVVELSYRDPQERTRRSDHDSE